MGGETDDEQGESQTFSKLRRAVLLQQSLQKTAKTFFQNTLHSLKSILVNGVSDLKPTIKSLSLNPLSCTKLPIPQSELHPIYISDTTTTNQLKPDHHAKVYYPVHEDTTPNNTTSRCHLIKASSDGAAFMKIKENNFPRKKSSSSPSLPKSESYHEGRRRLQGEAPATKAAANNFYLAQKMRELEMLDMGDVDHTMDVVEALHCYSCLTSPVYLDLVDNFFMDMYEDFSAPDDEKPEISIVSNSRSLSRRLDSNRGLMSSSSRRFGSSRKVHDSSSRRLGLSRRVHDSSSQRFSSSRRLGPIKAL